LRELAAEKIKYLFLKENNVSLVSYLNQTYSYNKYFQVSSFQMNQTTLASELIKAVDRADSSDSLIDAVEALADARLESAAPTLIAVLSYNNPGAAVAAVEGLVQLGEVAVMPLLNLLDDYNYGGRAWAIRALAEIGDPRALETLLEAAETDFSMSVRRAAAKGLGNLLWSKIPAAQVKQVQARVGKTLLRTSQDPEWVVRYASVAGLQGLANAVAIALRARYAIEQSDIYSLLKSHFQQMLAEEQDLAVRTRVRRAMQELGR